MAAFFVRRGGQKSHPHTGSGYGTVRYLQEGREGLATNTALCGLPSLRCSDVGYMTFLSHLTRLHAASNERNFIHDLYDASRDEPSGAGLSGLDPMRSRRFV